MISSIFTDNIISPSASVYPERDVRSQRDQFSRANVFVEIAASVRVRRGEGHFDRGCNVENGVGIG